MINKIKYNKELYCKESIFKTMFHFSEEIYFHIDLIDNYFCIEYEEKGTNIDFNKQVFETELIQQETRLLIRSKTKETRQLLLAQAFSSTILNNSNESMFSNKADIGEESTIIKNWFEDNNE